MRIDAPRLRASVVQVHLASPNGSTDTEERWTHVGPLEHKGDDQMTDAKKVARDVETTTKKPVRGLDGTSPKDRVRNAGDTVRKDLGNAGDTMRRQDGGPKR